jgi:hypothetical protein
VESVLGLDTLTLMVSFSTSRYSRCPYSSHISPPPLCQYMYHWMYMLAPLLLHVCTIQILHTDLRIHVPTIPPFILPHPVEPSLTRGRSSRRFGADNFFLKLFGRTQGLTLPDSTSCQSVFQADFIRISPDPRHLVKVDCAVRITN